MNEKAGTKDLDDDDIADTEAVEVSSDGDDNGECIPSAPVVPKGSKVKAEPSNITGPIARRSSTPARLQTKNTAHHLLKTISSALDPDLQRTRNDERGAFTFQATQIFALNSQLRDTQAMLEGLRTRLAEAERERNDAERRADRAELFSLVDKERAERYRRYKPLNRRCRRQDIKYPDGGSAVRWVGSSESDHAGDEPGIRRYTHDNPEPATPPPPSPTSSHASASANACSAD